MPLEIEFTAADLAALLPSAILCLTGVVALLADLFVPAIPEGMTAADRDASAHHPKSHLSWIGFGGGLLALVAIVFGGRMGGGEPGTALAGAITMDAFSGFAGALIVLAALFTALNAGPYLAAQGQHRGEFHGLLWMGAAAMVLLAQATNLISIFVAIETLSITVYVLAGFFRKWKLGSEGAMKYFVMGAFASGFLLLGMALLYGATGSVDLAALAVPRDDGLAGVGLLLLLVGFAFKIGAVPFHSWVPDVYQGSPAVAAGWMAVGVKAASFAALLRVGIAAEGGGDAFARVLAALAILTMVLGNLAAINQRNVKRMLAYSGIAHSGYLLLPVFLTFYRGTTKEVVGAVLFYLAAYLLMTLGAFTVVAAVSAGEKDREDVADFDGLASQRPLLALAFTISLLSLAGIPMTAGFVGKFLIFKDTVFGAVGAGGGAWDQLLFNLALVGILASIVSVYYYLRPVVAMYFHDSKRPQPVVEGAWGLHLTLGVTTIATLLIGIFPNRFIEWSQQAAQSLASN